VHTDWLAQYSKVNRICLAPVQKMGEAVSVPMSHLVTMSILALAYVLPCFAQPPNFDFRPNPNGPVRCVVVQTNDQILIGGDFSTVGGVPRNHIARLNPDGTLDLTFDPGADQPVVALVLQPDGRILLGGLFHELAGQSHTNIGRLNPNGSYDETFQCQAEGGVRAFALLPDNRILIGGGFTEVNGKTHYGIARLSSGGSVDSAYVPDVSGPVLALANQADGSVIVAGQFDSLNGQPRNSIGRLNSEGLIDTNFLPDLVSYEATAPIVAAVVVQPDGKILVGGDFEDLGGVPGWCYFGRLDSDGSLDPWFISDADEVVWSIALQPDGKILAGGEFETLGGAPRIFIGRVDSNGIVDDKFNAQMDSVNSRIFTVAVQPDSKILMGGSFGAVGGIARNHLARLYPDGALDGTYWDLRPTLEIAEPFNDGALRLIFLNPGLHPFAVLGSTNAALSTMNWNPLGVATNLGGGLFQFVDPGASNFPNRFYQLRWP